MNHHIEHIKDVMGNNYLGIIFDENEVKPFKDKLKEYLSEEEYETYTNLQKKRDNNKYHMTIINVMEYNKLVNENMSEFVGSLDLVFNYEINDLKMLGLGTAEKNNNRAYFIVCQSEKIDAVRSRFNLDNKDLHITLGFKFKDVHGVPKNSILENKSPFIGIIKQHYETDKNFDFIRGIENFDLDDKLEIIPIQLKETLGTFEVGDYFIQVGLVDDKLRVVSKYSKDKERPRLSNNEVLGIFKGI